MINGNRMVQTSVLFDKGEDPSENYCWGDLGGTPTIPHRCGMPARARLAIAEAATDVRRFLRGT